MQRHLVRRVKERQHPVADKLVDRARLPAQLPPDDLEIIGQFVHQFIRRHRLAVGGEPFDVGKENRQPPHFAAQLRLAPTGQHLPHEIARHVLDERPQARLHPAGCVVELVHLAHDRARMRSLRELELPHARHVPLEIMQRRGNAMRHERTEHDGDHQRRDRDNDHLHPRMIQPVKDHSARLHACHDALQPRLRVDVIEGHEILRRTHLDGDQMTVVEAVILEPRVRVHPLGQRAAEFRRIGIARRAKHRSVRFKNRAEHTVDLPHQAVE